MAENTIYEKLNRQIERLKTENSKLRKDAAHYRDLFMNSPLGLFRSTFEGRFIEVNSALAEMLGYKTPASVMEEVTDIGEQIYVRTEHRNEIVSKQKESTKIQQYTNHYKRRDGSTFIANLHLKTIYDADGTPLHLEGIIDDITDKRKLEKDLHKTRKHFDTIVNVLPQFIAHMDSELRYRYVNRTYEKEFGLRLKDILGKPLVEIIGPKAFEKAKPHIERVLKGEQVNYHEHYEYEKGGTRDIDGTLIPEFSDTGKVSGYFAVLTDISKYIAAREELENRASKLEQMNAALNILVEHRDVKKEKREVEIIDEFKKLVFPYLEIPAENKTASEISLIFDILNKNIQEILYGEKKTAKTLFKSFTPLEIQVANLIRENKTTKEIASVLGLGTRTVYFHRENIRKKLDLINQKTNLKAFLQSI